MDLIPSKLIPSVSLHLTWECRDCRKKLNVRHRKKIEELSEIQQIPLRRLENTVLVPENVKVPHHGMEVPVMEVLSFGPKHPAKVKFDEMSFSTDFFICLTEMGDTNAEAINELNAAAVWYRIVAKKDKGCRIFDGAKMFLKEKGLKAVPFDGGTGFCILKEGDYFEKLLRGSIRSAVHWCNKRRKFVTETGTNFDKELQVLYQNHKFDKGISERSRSCGTQPARLSGLVKVHKEGIPLRSVLSLSGSCYERLTNLLSKFFEDLPKALIERSTQKMKEKKSKATLAR